MEDFQLALSRVCLPHSFHWCRLMLRFQWILRTKYTLWSNLKFGLPRRITNDVEIWIGFFHNEVVVRSHFVTAPNCPILGCIFARLRCSVDPLFGLDGCSQIASTLSRQIRPKRRRGVNCFQTCLWRVPRRLFSRWVLFDWQVDSFFRNTSLSKNESRDRSRPSLPAFVADNQSSICAT